MNIADIKKAVDAGNVVHWKNAAYVVHKDCIGQYLITFQPNGDTIGLTNKAGDRLNGQPHDFFVSVLTGGHSSAGHTPNPRQVKGHETSP